MNDAIGSPNFDSLIVDHARKDFPLLDANMSVAEALDRIRREGVGERVIYFFAIDAARNPQKIHSAGTVAEYFLSVVSGGGRIAWDTSEKGEFEFVHSFEQAKGNPQCERAWVLSRCPRMVFHPNFVSTDDARLI
jgi:hypothetical protein